MLSRRRFVTMAAVTTGLGLTRTPLSDASAATPALDLTASIDGRAIDRTAVLQWEARRLRVAAERLSHHLPAGLTTELGSLLDDSSPDITTVPQDRERLVDVKLSLGQEEIRDRMAPDLAITTPMSTLAAAANEWSTSSCEISASIGTAQGFLGWFNGCMDRNDERAMLIANPDHYLIDSPRPGAQEVIEVTGGALLAARFLIDYSDNAGVPIARDPLFPVQTSGWARSGEGTKIGGVRHQFRDNPQGGFTAKLAVAFPATLPPRMFSEHQWHLACEFSNWVSGYVASTRT
ncbi:hypothetical protein ACFQ8C_15535 [Streptomyces sp. NPDC056503]|uniref:hypothetical protein n=1 Tax=Streptomyces sp. NPDC056503 TaxID=3345842 RepID=UPI0036BF461C